jgi:hypothetical protein
MKSRNLDLRLSNRKTTESFELVFLFKVDTNAAAFPPMIPSIEKALTLSGAFPIGQLDDNSGFNSVRLHRAQMPAANGISNARSLARIYALLIGDIDENGTKKRRLLNEKTLAQAVTNITPPGEPDLSLFGLTSKFAKGGFQIYGDFFNVLGEGVFGHTGKLYIDTCYLYS